MHFLNQNLGQPLIICLFFFMGAGDIYGQQNKGLKGGDSIAIENLKRALKQTDVEDTPHTTISHLDFDPHAKQYEYIDNATPSTTNTLYFNARNQPVFHKIGRYFLNNVLIISCFSIVFILLLMWFFKKDKGEGFSFKQLGKRQLLITVVLPFLILFSLTGGFGTNEYLTGRYIDLTETPIWGTGSEIRWKILFPCSLFIVVFYLAIGLIYNKVKQ